MNWRSCPFEIGKRYLVLKDIEHLNHHFAKGSIVTFKDHGYDFHQGVTRYWFENAATSETNAWHVFDNQPDPSETWSGYFQPL